MSRLLIVRHGQASAGTGDYDQLSERGYRQARLLGEQWAAEGLVPDGALIGPRKRHRQTAETVAEQGDGWPETALLEGWDEHEAFAVVMHSIPVLSERDPWVRERAEISASGGDGDALRAYFDLYKHITRLWVREELDLDGAPFEPWPEFRRRVSVALERLVESQGRGKTIAVFTSSGPVGVAAGHSLGLGDERMMELSWIVQNISVTEIVYDDDTLTLKSFNALPRMTDSELRTLI